MAKFLQETVKDTGLKADSVVRSDEFKEFFRKVRLCTTLVGRPS
jgi:LETM1 and EF-hand domain-containing protein 1